MAPPPTATAPATALSADDTARAQQLVARIRNRFSQTLVGQENLRESLITTMVAGGHILIESVPGLAKTTAAQTLATAVSGSFKRVQCTPDLMPSDLVGTQVFDFSTQRFTTQIGPIHANFVLLDEINRSNAKTQSAMLEAMAEGATTIGGQRIPLPKPFMVIATQNPIEEEGTFNLPEAQMDRFMFKLLVGFPSVKELADIVNMTQVTMEETADAVVDGATILAMRELAKSVPVVPDVLYYAMRLVARTHPELEDSGDTAKKYIKYGCSPRAGQALITAAKVRALIDGRYNVSYEDINSLAYPVLRHRMKINYTAINEKLTVDDVIDRLISENAKEKGSGKLDADKKQEAPAETAIDNNENTDAVEESATPVKKKKKLFGNKKD